ncbi:MAG TPA: molybdopterin-dependent oxidoreductase, partial [Candidatus Dormibacteraeota bacterium]|nr:molybdopterin-dependent oxidoreductase [Candidatus Dormibacteraeota bacterium]
AWPVRVLAPAAALSLASWPLVAVGQGSWGLAALGSSFVDWLLVAALLELALDAPAGPAVRPGRRAGMTPAAQLSRRTLLQAAGATAGGVTVALLGLRVLRPVRVPIAPLLAGASGFGDLSGITPPADFYVVSKNLLGDPAIAAATWRLSVGGTRPFVLGYADLQSLPHVEQVQTLECISNPVGGALMSTGRFTGVRLVDLLQRAGLPPDTVQVAFRSADGYTESLPLVAALAPTTLVADHLDGRPLPRAHGAPARILVVGRYGMKSPKWLTEITPVNRPVQGYWEQRGWNAAAIVRTTARFDHPAGDVVWPRGRPLPLRGVAFAGDRGIARVEVSVDGGGRWVATRLQPVLAPGAWRLWTRWWAPSPGFHTFFVRAVDGEGHVQTAAGRGSYPAGATGYDAITVQVA